MTKRNVVSDIDRVSDREHTVLAGERTNFEGKAVANAILLAMPDEASQSLRGSLEHVALAPHPRLCQPKQNLEFAYFLNSGIIPIVFETREHDRVEVGV